MVNLGRESSSLPVPSYAPWRTPLVPGRRSRENSATGAEGQGAYENLALLFMEANPIEEKPMLTCGKPKSVLPEKKWPSFRERIRLHGTHGLLVSPVND